MASVPMSWQTKDEILRQVDKARDAELESRTQDMRLPSMDDPATVEHVTNFLWQGVAFDEVSNRRQLSIDVLTPSLRLRLYTRAEIPMPPAAEQYLHGLDIVTIPVAELGRFAHDIVEFAKVKREVHERYGKIRTDLGVFLGSCGTVNKALREFPDLQLYLTESIKGRLAEKTSRTKATSDKAKEALQKIDTAAIAAAGVAATLRG